MTRPYTLWGISANRWVITKLYSRIAGKVMGRYRFGQRQKVFLISILSRWYNIPSIRKTNEVYITDILSVLGDHIIALRATGMSYKDISKAIPCSMGTISYYLGSGQKEKTVSRNKVRRRNISTQIKAEHGGCCAVCGYNKCIAALEFDHLKPEEKSYTISSRRNDMPSALLESEKCLLLCCRCHRERHAGLLDIGAYLAPDL